MRTSLLVLAVELSFAHDICRPWGVVVTEGKVAVSAAVNDVIADDFSRDHGWSCVNLRKSSDGHKEFLVRKAMVVGNVDKTRHETAFELPQTMIGKRLFEDGEVTVEVTTLL